MYIHPNSTNITNVLNTVDANNTKLYSDVLDTFFCIYGRLFLENIVLLFGATTLAV